MTSRNVRARAFSCVRNNPTEEDLQRWHDLPADYKILGREHFCTCPEYATETDALLIQAHQAQVHGTPHYQAYCRFLHPQRLDSIIAKLPGWHIEKALGTPEQNITYCSKEDPEPEEHGARPTLNGHLRGNIQLLLETIGYLADQPALQPVRQDINPVMWSLHDIGSSLDTARAEMYDDDLLSQDNSDTSFHIDNPFYESDDSDMSI